MILLNSKYQNITLDEDSSLMTLCYSPQTFYMTDNEFKKELIDYIELLKIYTPYRMLFDMKTFGFKISKTMENWIDENISSVEKEITKIQAFVVDKDALEQNAAVQEVLNLTNNQQMLTKFFDTIEEAKAWLMLFDNNTN